MLGMQIESSRGNITSMLQSFGGAKMTGKQFAEHLGTLATSVACLQDPGEDTCDAPAGTHDRVSMVQTLDLLIDLLDALRFRAKDRVRVFLDLPKCHGRHTYHDCLEKSRERWPRSRNHY